MIRPRDLEVLATWRETQNWTTTARIHNMNRYEAKKRATRAIQAMPRPQDNEGVFREKA